MKPAHAAWLAAALPVAWINYASAHATITGSPHTEAWIWAVFATNTITVITAATIITRKITREHNIGTHQTPTENLPRRNRSSNRTPHHNAVNHRSGGRHRRRP